MNDSEVRAVDVLAAKRRGERHGRRELQGFIDGFLAGEIADYQVSAWLMAVCLNGMDARETTDLTEILAGSGDVLDLSGLPYPVDKHSTGGVGDKTSLVLAPLLAQAGATVAKMSGRGLGHTGGTVDKLESFSGFRSELSDAEFMRQAREVGVVVTGQSKAMAPADGYLYALRDATATVDSLPLIASSIMSKKLAGGAESIVLDIKVGSGAFMKTTRDAGELARTMMEIGRLAGRNVSAVLSSMEQPLGLAVGNALEVQEAVACLRGEGPADLEELCVLLARQVLESAGIPRSDAELVDLLRSGQALERFERWIEAQGGDPGEVDRFELAPGRHVLEAPAAGVLTRVDALAVGRAAGQLGGGRRRKEDRVDHGVGIVLAKKVGEPVEAGEPLARIYHRDGRGLAAALAQLEDAFTVAPGATAPELVLERLTLEQDEG